jgi:hypothetical protein
MGLEAHDIEVFVEAYQGDENGHPAQIKMGPNCSHPVYGDSSKDLDDLASGDASDWYWAIKHAGSDAWGTCPARRMVAWYRGIGQDAFWYYWSHVPDGPNGCGGAHHANEQPFVFREYLDQHRDIRPSILPPTHPPTAARTFMLTVSRARARVDR